MISFVEAFKPCSRVVNFESVAKANLISEADEIDMRQMAKHTFRLVNALGKIRGVPPVIGVKKKAALLAVFGGIIILLMKLLAYFLSNSVALLSDALESIVNIVASGIMLFSVHISEKPADDSHNYGHQKIEELSRLLEGIFIITAALLIIYAAAGRLFDSSRLFELNLAVNLQGSPRALAVGGSATKPLYVRSALSISG
jgi:hypothetical protein